MKRFLIIIAVLLLAGVGYFTYEKWVRHSDISIWSFMPESAIAVYESDRILDVFDTVRTSDVWKNLSHIPAVYSLEKTVETLDTLTGRGNFTAFFQDNPTLISLHIVSNHHFDFLYVVEIQDLSQHTYLSQSLNFFSQQGYAKRTREYLDFTITEVAKPGAPRSFTYIFYKNYFIGSFTAFLVEDAIRTISENNVSSFRKQFRELIPVTKLERDQGNLYVNISRLPDFIELFTSPTAKTHFANSAFLDVKVTNDVINLNGFTFTDQPPHYFSIFQSSTGASFDMAEIIPNSTAWMHHISFTDGSAFGQSLNGYFERTASDVLNKRKELLGSIDFDVNYTFQLLDEEIGIVTLENSREEAPDKLLILEIKDMGEALNYFNSVGERVAATLEDSVYVEPYGEFEIRKLPAKAYPYALLGNIAGGFDQCFYISYRNYLVFSNSIYQLKHLLTSIENEDTWNKSMRFNRFLEKTNREANFSLFINTLRSWNQILESLNPEWRAFFSAHQFALRNLEYLAFQFSNVDRKFYTNITVFQPDLPSRAVPEKIEAEKSILLSGPIVTKPYIVTNHSTKSKEVILQDSLHNVYLVSDDFEVIWFENTGRKVISDFHQIDYYKNGKLQYLFSTDQHVYLIDRTGELVPGFPVSLPDNRKIAYFTVIDYDNSKNYRYAITDTNGNVFLTDKNVRPLEGWAPRKLDGPLARSPQHIRINAKDIIIVTQENGKIHFLTRRSTHYNNFPLNIGTDLTDNFYIDASSSLANSEFTTITEGGEIIGLNFEGKVIRRDQLYKPAVSTIFHLVEDVTGDGYIIVRNTEKRYEVLDEAGNLLFEKDYFSNQRMLIQYYKLGGGVEWIIFVDPGGKYLFIYDQDGTLITGRPLTATVPVSVLQYESEYEIYLGSDAELSVVSIPK